MYVCMYLQQSHKLKLKIDLDCIINNIDIFSLRIYKKESHQNKNVFWSSFTTIQSINLFLNKCFITNYF